MQISELEELPVNFWVNPETRELLPSDDEHYAMIRNNPERFGLDQELIDQITDALPESQQSSAIYQAAGDNGWVRAGKVFGSTVMYFFQASSELMAWKAVRMIYRQAYLEDVIIEPSYASWQERKNTAFELKGDELVRWLKRKPTK